MLHDYTDYTSHSAQWHLCSILHCTALCRKCCSYHPTDQMWSFRMQRMYSTKCRKFSWMIVIEGVQNDWPLETPPFSTSPSNKDVLAETLKNPKQPNPVHHVLAACPESCTAKAAKVLMQSGWWRGLQKDMFCNLIQQGFSKGKNGSSSFSGWICSTLSCTNLSIKSESNWPNSDTTHIPQCGTFLNIHSVTL